MVESFKPEYKDEDEGAGLGMRMHPGMIRTERLRRDYGCSILAWKEVVSLVETNEGSSNSTSRRRERGKGEESEKVKAGKDKIRRLRGRRIINTVAKSLIPIANHHASVQH